MTSRSNSILALAAALLLAPLSASAETESDRRYIEGLKDIYGSLTDAMSPADALDTLHNTTNVLADIDFENLEGLPPEMDDDTEGALFDISSMIGDLALKVMLACMVTTNMPVELCACVSIQAQDDFDETGMELLSAIMVGDRARVDQLKPQVSFDTLTRAGMYLVRVPPTCTP